jgi:hypothetical protein
LAITAQAAKAKEAIKAKESIPNWQITVNYVETCNCDFGCPCNFSGFPTFGFCRALVLYNIVKGRYGDVSLDGIPVVYAASWPKAIHEGEGTMQLYIGEHTNSKQREAVAAIIGGKAKGDGPFAIFAGTLKYALEPRIADVKVKIDGKNSSFSVPGVLEVKAESFKNPVTGVEAETEVHIPKGFIFQTAKACKTKVMRIVSPNISFDDSGQNAFFCQTLTFKGP